MEGRSVRDGEEAEMEKGKERPRLRGEDKGIRGGGTTKE